MQRPLHHDSWPRGCGRMQSSRPITWDYDMLGRRIAASDPDLGTGTYSYDGVGTSSIADTGIFLTYDCLNRICAQHYCSGTALAICQVSLQFQRPSHTLTTTVPCLLR